jgi:hypothetical protein
MSFRWFIYYCAVCGGCAALVGWTLGKFPSLSPSVLLDAFKALCVGVMLGAVLALIDSLVNFSWGQVFLIASRVLTAGFIGGLAGFFGGLITGGVTRNLNILSLQIAGQILGWTLTGLLIGASVGVFDLLLARRTAESRPRPIGRRPRRTGWQPAFFTSLRSARSLIWR